MIQTLPLSRSRAARARALALGLLTPSPSPAERGATGDDDKSPVQPRSWTSSQPRQGRRGFSKPLYGGRAIIHIPSLVESTNYAVENSAYTRNFLYECHEMLLLQDWWTTEYVPCTARSSWWRTW